MIRFTDISSHKLRPVGEQCGCIAHTYVRGVKGENGKKERKGEGRERVINETHP